MIMGEIKRYLRDNNSIRVSRSTKDLAYKALKLKRTKSFNYGSRIRGRRNCQRIEVGVYDVIHALDSLRDPISMFEPIYNDGGDTIYLYDQIEDKKQTAKKWESQLTTKDALHSLNKRQQHILDERFVIGKTQMEIAEELSISLKPRYHG